MSLLDECGITPHILRQRGFVPQAEATELVLAETGEDGRQYLLTPEANHSWQSMKRFAANDGVQLVMISAFRSVQRQTEIIRDKLAEGLDIQEILQVCAPPGYSEHHTGRAIDIGTPEHMDLEIAFETTPAFHWLQQHAAAFGFQLSYPPGNSAGYQYEPWHWCLHENLHAFQDI
ncbi:MAG: M15 family metallopeptidase [Burkholderiales bacterium]|nr:M15 family metallopeptidase [Burkholderiales bacterium]